MYQKKCHTAEQEGKQEAKEIAFLIMGWSTTMVMTYFVNKH